MKITKCPHCGTIIAEGLSMCPHCGAQLGNDLAQEGVEVAAGEPAKQAGPAEKPEKEKKKKKEKKQRELKLSTKVLLTSIVMVLVCVAFKVLAFVFAASEPAAHPDSLWLKIDFFFSVLLVFSLLPIPFLIKGWWKKLLGVALVALLGSLWVLQCIHMYNGILWTVKLF